MLSGYGSMESVFSDSRTDAVQKDRVSLWALEI